MIPGESSVFSPIEPLSIHCFHFILSLWYPVNLQYFLQYSITTNYQITVFFSCYFVVMIPSESSVFSNITTNYYFFPVFLVVMILCESVSIFSNITTNYIIVFMFFVVMCCYYDPQLIVDMFQQSLMIVFIEVFCNIIG